MLAVQRLTQNTFLRHNLVFFVGSVVVGALNYVYYPVVGRLLTPAAFGEVQTLISLFLQVAIFLTVLGLVTINVVANYHSTEQRDAVVLEFEHLAFVVSLGLLALTALFQIPLKHFLQFDDTWPFILLMIALVATVPLTFRGSFLRGRQRFGLTSAVNVISAGGKLLFSILFVLLGWGTAGAIGGLVAAQCAAWVASTWWARQNGLHGRPVRALMRLPDMRLLRPELAYGVLVLIGSLLVTLQYSVDIVIVKHIFDPHTAGLYAGVASVARILFFLTASVALVLMPLVKVDAKPEANRRLLYKSLGLLGAVGVPTLAVFVAAPRWVVGLLMGQAYTPMAYLLPALSVAIFTVSIVNLVVSYYLALRRFAVAPIIIIGAAITYGLLAAHHGSPRAVVNNLLIGSITMLALLLLASKGLKARS